MDIWFKISTADEMSPILRAGGGRDVKSRRCMADVWQICAIFGPCMWFTGTGTVSTVGTVVIYSTVPISISGRQYVTKKWTIQFFFALNTTVILVSVSLSLANIYILKYIFQNICLLWDYLYSQQTQHQCISVEVRQECLCNGQYIWAEMPLLSGTWFTWAF